MPKFRGMVVRYGYVTIEAADEKEALEQVEAIKLEDFDWSDCEDAQIVEEVDY